ncbi:MAG: cyclic nucleotide-binding domain-containing protein [Actinomycetota bacterium]
MTEPSIDTAALRETGLFAGLSDQDVQGMLDVGEPLTFSADQAVFEAGDQGDAMYVVAEGEARVDVGGRFHILKAGNFFGEMALIAPGRRMATVKAVTDLSVLRIPAERFEDFLLEHPSVSVALLKALVVRLREVEQRIDAWMA